jgi:hypothetical protein
VKERQPEATQATTTRDLMKRAGTTIRIVEPKS